MTATPLIQTERLELLPLDEQDAPEMVEVLADPALYSFIGGSPPSLDALTAQYRRWVDGSPSTNERWHNWVIRLRDGRAAVGHVQATVVETDGAPATADIAWVVGTPWQGRGYASESALALVEWLDASGLGAIAAHVHPENVASARVAARAGLEATDETDDGEVVWRRRRHTSGDA